MQGLGFEGTSPAITGRPSYHPGVLLKIYLDALDTADRTASPAEFQAKAEHIEHKLRTMREQMHRLKLIEQRLGTEPDGQISLTDPDARSMATSGRGSGTVAYNVQVAVDNLKRLIAILGFAGMMKAVGSMGR